MITGSRERQREISDARYAVGLRALQWITDELQHRGDGTVRSGELTDQLEAACMTLTDALRKPATCPQCHQEIHEREQQ